MNKCLFFSLVRAQFLRLQPFEGPSAIGMLLEDVSPHGLDEADNLVRKKSCEELLKPYGPNQDNVLTYLCGREDSSKLRAQIFCVTKRLLANVDPEVRAAVTRQNGVGSTALDFAALTNKTAVALFLAEVFFILGEDLNGAEDHHGNTLVHLLARRGDGAAAALKALLAVRVNGRGAQQRNSRKQLISTGPANKKGELPVHVAAKLARCQIETLQALHVDRPDCCAARTRAGDLPLHYACQFGRDPSLLVMLLHFDRGAVNARRNDGFTPLHLVAAR